MEWGTRLLARLRDDPFLSAQVRTAFLYFFMCLLILIVVGSVVDAETRRILSQLTQTPPPYTVEDAIQQVERARIAARAFYVFTFAIGAYALIGSTLRPIREATERQRRVISNISHELRTPLTLASTEIDLALKDTNITRDEAVRVLSQSRKDLHHLGRIIQFLLSLSDFQTPRARLDTKPISLREIVETVRLRYAEPAHRKGVSLSLAPTSEDPVVKGNSIALEKLIDNLVRNAIAHTSKGGSVLIEMRDESGSVLVTVRDTGDGIDPKDLPNLFEPFYRGANAEEGGSGLGLSIVKEIARLHHARVDVTSTLGAGSAFTVTFPST